MTTAIKYTFKDFASDQDVRWCPGCDDYVILRSIQKALPEIGKKKEDIVFISGIGCSSRFPYYMDNYGIHGIHGRAAAIATGTKLANPKLSVWVASGDGDAMAIGGNHFIHFLRRNIDINYILFNNEIYGLTKGQFSPTSLLGQRTKSSPYGNAQAPFNPGELAIGAHAKFFARAAGNDSKLQTKLYIEAEKHKGAALVEILQNCVIFNDGAYKDITDKTVKEDHQLVVEHGKPMIFGKNKDKGLVLDGMKLKVATIGENGITEDDILVHDAKEKDVTMHLALINLKSPVVMGVIRAVEEETLIDRENKITEIAKQTNPIQSFEELLFSGQTFEVEG